MFLVLYLVIFLSIEQSDADSSLLARLPDIMVNFCPGVNVCRGNQTSLSQEKTFKPGYGSCCSECSCRLDCAENGNCCFPRHHFISNDNRACIFPTTSQPKERQRHFFRSYSMVARGPETRRENDTTITCGDVNVAPWGSLYPVYSSKNRQIYKNMECAVAHGAVDGLLWNAVLVCDTGAESFDTDVSSYVLGLDSNSINDNCVVQFSFPGDEDEIEPLTCYVSPIQTCSNNTFEVPAEVGVSKEDVIDLCTSSLLSPYKARKLYANVFCHICSGEYFVKDRVCKDLQNTDTFKGVGQTGFIALINEELIQSGKPEKIAKPPIACDLENKTKCRPLLCPSGQLRDWTGNCKYQNKLWYNQEFTILINLTSLETINISEVFQVKPNEYTKIFPASFKSPWSGNWYIFYMDYRLTRQNITGTFLSVALKNQQSAVRPRNIINNVKKLHLRDWFLKYDNSTIVFRSDLSSSKRFRTSSSSDRVDDLQVIDFGNNAVEVSKPRYRRVYFSGTFPGNTHWITKLHLCQQVELAPSEFSLSINNRELFNHITKRVLFDSEFVLVRNILDGVVRARICVQDSGMDTENNIEMKNAGMYHHKSDGPQWTLISLFCSFVPVFELQRLLLI